MILVTGATGFVGNHVARYVAGQNERLRVLVRRSSDLHSLDSLDAEICVGDLVDRDALRRAVHGCRAVLHVAAQYRLWTKRPDLMYRVNVEGTRKILEVAREAAVDRFVHTSTVGTIAPAPDGAPVTERVRSSLSEMVGHYKRSKFLAERAAEQFASKGMPVVIVNPTAPVGERDFKPTPTGRIIVDFLEGRLPAYIDTGLNLVDVRDVARGHWLALNRGRPGERYLLGSQNLSLRRILRMLAAVSGRRAPRVRLPYFAGWMAGAASTGFAGISGRPPRIPIESVRMARKAMYADCGKAACELGYEPAPVIDALRRAVSWFQGRARATDRPVARPPGY